MAGSHGVVNFKENVPLAQVNPAQTAIKYVAKVVFGVQAVLRALVVSLVLSTAFSAPASARTSSLDSGQRYVGTVSWVVDGDTIWIKTAGSDGLLKVRMLGMDAPEICQEGGIEARDALRLRIHKQSVTVVTPRSRSHDDYGRLLGRVEFRGEDMGRWMVSNGQAWSYQYRKSAGPYAAEQGKAQAARRGLFVQPNPENPRVFRKRHGSCHQ